MAHITGGFVAGDVGVIEPEFAALGADVGIREADFALPNRLYLGAGEGDTRFKSLADEVVVICLFVGGDDFDVHG